VLQTALPKRRRQNPDQVIALAVVVNDQGCADNSCGARDTRPQADLQLRNFRARLVEGTGVQDRSHRFHRRVNSAAWSLTKSAMLVGVSPVSLR